jgi:phage baseplate assembly protein W
MGESNMTKTEREAMNLTAQLWNKLNELPAEHPDDINDLRFHIHAIQNIIYTRVGMRVSKNQAFGERLHEMLLKK